MHVPANHVLRGDVNARQERNYVRAYHVTVNVGGRLSPPANKANRSDAGDVLAGATGTTGCPPPSTCSPAPRVLDPRTPGSDLALAAEVSSQSVRWPTTSDDQHRDVAHTRIADARHRDDHSYRASQGCARSPWKSTVRSRAVVAPWAEEDSRPLLAFARASPTADAAVIDGTGAALGRRREPAGFQ